ncbi:MAG: ATP-binding protein [Clostridium sp.]|nr:ATP-binding protein [Clostridium sp.]
MAGQKKLPIGIDRFEKLRDGNYYYVDKTGMIKELLDEACEVNLFTRPRRFGKSLNLDMLKSFFEIGAEEKLFEGLEILEHRDMCAEYLGKYPVIFLDLKDVDGDDYAAAYQALCSIVGMEIRRLCVKYSLLENGRLLETDKVFLQEVLADKYDKGIAICLRRLFQLLFEVCSKKVIFLIDEYDVPLDKAYQKGYYEQMLEVVRNLLSTTLKSNSNLQFAVLTGCLRIAKESIFIGLNNFVVNSISDVEYSEYFGFTEHEVLRMLRYYGLEDYQCIIREWYDGYRFGDTSVYCPWDVLNYLRKLRRDKKARPESFWVNSSSNAIIQNILSDASETTKEQLEMLISGEAIEKELAPELTYKDLENPNVENREIYLWSVMYATGYLTELARLENGASRLKIPNREIWDIYNEKIKLWFNKNIRSNTDRLRKICEAVKGGNAEEVQSVFNDCMRGTISIRDTYARKEMKENFYHGMLLGILQCEGSWAVKSNQESGVGYGDILLTSPRDKIGCVIEVKYAEAGFFETACRKAVEQIEKNQYADYFVQKDIKIVHAYGIACYKKECRVAHKRMEM